MWTLLKLQAERTAPKKKKKKKFQAILRDLVHEQIFLDCILTSNNILKIRLLWMVPYCKHQFSIRILQARCLMVGTVQKWHPDVLLLNSQSWYISFDTWVFWVQDIKQVFEQANEFHYCFSSLKFVQLLKQYQRICNTWTQSFCYKIHFHRFVSPMDMIWAQFISQPSLNSLMEIVYCSKRMT